jgi:uncharacterized protein YndB with AHSA1/START domain
MLGVLATASLAPAVPGKDNPEDFTRIYRHTYDEVFQAVQEEIERKGWFITDADKDKGTITGTFTDRKYTFEIRIETVSPKPETRVAMNFNWKEHRTGPKYKAVALTFFSELQKLLATYK